MTGKRGAGERVNSPPPTVLFQQAKLYHFCNGPCQKGKEFVDCFSNKILRLAAVLEWLGEVVGEASGWVTFVTQ